MRVIQGLVPPSGWHFRQKLNSSPQRPQYQLIQAQTYDQLVDSVFKFRLNNLEMVPSGTATQEIVASDIQFYICGRYPNNCTGSRAELNAAQQGNPPRGKATISGYSRPSNRIEAWLTKLSESNLQWVDQATAMERANICIACKLNQKWSTGCGPCNANVSRRAMLLRGSHVTGLETRLKGCVSYGTLNELSVWLENDFSAPRNRPKPPPQCWKLAEALTTV
jgi:hypothetical protein